MSRPALGGRHRSQVTVAVPSATQSLWAFYEETEPVFGSWSGVGWPVHNGIAYRTGHFRMIEQDGWVLVATKGSHR